MKFDLLTIDELGELGRGRSRHRPRDDESLYNGVYPFVQTGDVKHAPFYITSYYQTYNEKGFAQSKLWNPGTLCITIAANIADTAILSFNACFPDSILGFIPHKGKSNVKFIKYCFDVYKTTLEAISKGTTQDNLSLDKLRKIKFKIPKFRNQNKIAAVLSAYDDLIENNNRRIAILEKMAGEFYREWFVRLRFPGHERVKIVKGVPEGWEVVELSKIAQEVSNSTKPGSHLENRFYLPIDLLQQRHFNPESHLGYEEALSSLVTFQKGDMLFGAMRPYLHKVCIAPFNGITRTTCFVIRPWDEAFYSYLYLSLFQNSTIEYATLICNGADRPYVVWNKAFERMPIFKPSEEIVQKFENLVRSIISKISGSYFYIETLKTSRDRLLSRLMSGKIDVEDLDIRFPASMGTPDGDGVETPKNS